MRVPSPASLRIDRNDLLADLVERLEERAPEAIRRDPTDPAWLVLEEAAWMVEVLTEQLDRYPWAIVQQLAHLLGVRLAPARPAVGVVALEALTTGRVVAPPDVSPWRFITLQTEQAGLVEFELAEPEVPVRAVTVAGLARLREGELWRIAPSRPSDLPGQVAWAGEASRSAAFSREIIQYRFVTTDTEALIKDLGAAIERLGKERAPGWLSMEVGQDGDRVLLQAILDPNLAFASAPEGGGDLTGPWRSLDDSTWTPPVRIAAHPVLPPRLRDARPMREGDDALLVPDVPANMLVNELLVREARPAPDEVPQAIWQTLVHMERKLAALRPEVRRGVAPTGDDREPDWVDDALRGGAWFRVAERPDQTFAKLAFEAERTPGPLRLAWVHEGSEDLEVRAFALFDDSGMLPDPLVVTPAWSLVLPDPDRGRMVRVQAVTVDVPPSARGVLTTLPGAAVGVIANAAMVVNAPRVEDDRTVVVERAVPDAVSLLADDIVSREVVDALASGGLPDSAAARLRDLPLSRIDVLGDEPIIDFEGLALDPAEGTLTMMAPDATGAMRRLRRDEELTLRWYRRTEGSGGNVPVGAIAFVEQAPTVRPRLTGVTNPLPTAWGLDREDAEEAIRRVFGPPAGVPVTPTDWEREIRIALGARARGWHVRVWGHAERAFLSTALWPVASGPGPSTQVDALRASLGLAGPDTLMVVLGTPSGPPSSVDQAWADEVVQALVRRWSARLPAIRRAIVAPMHVLRLDGFATIPLPTHALDGLTGSLVDDLGRRAAVPEATLLLNAIVTGEVRA